MSALTVVLLLVGFVILIKGADLLVDGASALAKKIGASELMIGLTIVAFGTSAPELIVNVFASIQGKAEITFGNIIGSNIANILLILGVAGIIRPIMAGKSTVWREIPYSLFAAVFLFLICNDALIMGLQESRVNRLEAGILLFFFVVFLVYSIRSGMKEVQETPEIKSISMWKSLFFIILGLAGLVFGGKLVVDNAILIAQALHVSEKLIGLTIIAIGTSLPELATSAVAAYKGKNDIAIGNIVGSNIFNIFFILAVSAMIGPLPYQTVLNVDIYVMIGGSVFLFLAMLFGKRYTLHRWEAGVLLAGYIAYTVYLIIRR